MAQTALPREGAPALPYDERGTRAEKEQPFLDGGHSQNGISIAPCPIPMEGVGLSVSRPPHKMLMGHVTGQQPPSDAITHEAAARSQHDRRLRAGEEPSLPRTALATSVGLRDAGRHTPLCDDAADRPRQSPDEAWCRDGRELPVTLLQEQQTLCPGGRTQQHWRRATTMTGSGTAILLPSPRATRPLVVPTMGASFLPFPPFPPAGQHQHVLRGYSP